MAPEVFWNGEESAAADVYAIALIMYAGLKDVYKRQEEKTVCINNIACADLYAVAVFFADEVDGLFLPA